MKSVFIIQRRMTAYRVPLFERLRKRLAESGVELGVVYGDALPDEMKRTDFGELPWGIKTGTRTFRAAGANLYFMSLPWKMLLRGDLVIIPQENSMMNNYIIMLLRRLRGGSVAFWGHGANFQDGGRSGIREKFKAILSRHVDWWFAYTDLSVRTVKSRGFPPEKITCLNNAIDTARKIEWLKGISEDEKNALKKTLGMAGKNAAVFLGSLAADKKLDVLFSAADLLRKKIPDFELLLIGDGPLRDMVSDYASSRPWVKWVGRKVDREKLLHLSLGRIMLNPGMVGLSILDAFAAGIPIVTTDCGIHSPEIAYLRHGENGIMTEDDLGSFAAAAEHLLKNPEVAEAIGKEAGRDALKYSLEDMVENFASGIEKILGIPSTEKKMAAGPRTPVVCVIWQRFLPYHEARISRLSERLEKSGYGLVALEVASVDSSYGFVPPTVDGKTAKTTCFPGRSYHDLNRDLVYQKVFELLRDASPDIVFAPATPFPEGMAAVSYRTVYGKKMIMMDDAWEKTDLRGGITRRIKKTIHRNIDGVFIPAPSHSAYYRGMGFTDDRIVFGVDVVDNEFFFREAEKARGRASFFRKELGLPENYFLFAGRFLKKKGIETLIEAYRTYRQTGLSRPWELVLVGDGDCSAELKKKAGSIGGITFAGAKSGSDICVYYGLSKAVVVPSIADQWGLVVNEAAASGLPVLVSSGCGSAATLVEEGSNGWTFPPGDPQRLCELLLRISGMDPSELQKMGRRSIEIVSGWSLDKFSDGVLEGAGIPRRPSAGVISDLLTDLWKGHIRKY